MQSLAALDFNNPTEKAAHDKMVGLVEKMLDAKKKFNEACTDSDRRFYERLCESLDVQIDESVYELYEITPEERAIIEKS